jgi:hypothetical protein
MRPLERERKRKERVKRVSNSVLDAYARNADAT